MNTKFWVQALNSKGENYTADCARTRKEAHQMADEIVNEATGADYAEVYIWENMVDDTWGNQPNYSIDPVWMWKK